MLKTLSKRLDSAPKNRAWPLSLLLTALMIFLFWFIFGIRYEVNDDALISDIAAGAFGPDTHYLIYVNIAIGWILKPFYWLFPSLNWFVVLQFAGGFLCFAYLGVLLLRKCGLKQGFLIYTTFLLLAGEEFFTRFHYVKYAGLFAACGLLLLAQNIGTCRYKAILGIFLAVLGSFLRFPIFCAVGGLAAPMLISKYFTLEKQKRKLAVVSVISLCLVSFLFYSIDYWNYQQDADWAYYQNFNSIRTEISDFRLQYADPQDIEPLGYTQTDFTMLENWTFYDSDVYSIENLQEINAALPGNRLFSAIKTTLVAAAQTLYSSPVHLLFGAILFVWILLLKRKNWRPILCTLAVFGLFLFFLCWRGRYIDRIDYPLVLAAMIFCAYLLPEPEKRPPWQATALVCSVLVLASLSMFSTRRATAADYWASRPARAAAFDALSADKQTLYLVDTYLVDAAAGYNVWQARPKDYFSNIVFVGSWLMQSPLQNDVLTTYGIENPYRDIVDRPDVLTADLYHLDNKTEYIRQYYAPDAEAVQVSENADFNLYAFITK